MRIGELARRTGVSQRLLRYYEEQGLLTPQRLPSGYRVYTDSDVLRVAHIRSLLAAGLSTDTIAEVLPCMGVDGERLIASICPELVDELLVERARISASIQALQEAQSALDTIITARPAASSTAAPAPAGSP
ncbi:DNA-binding transcriptional MerR regulator [Lentzea atacamensis]|uniref:DNA-binding transcriptional MerR regulator n=1 Tax=Lentzea atacamensis TaxID=531938 RepID=A0A316HNY4_9PSEU|nr:MerR family transcriptional regulator [Lentzea atacamensis]PWK82028.1 DNA-binding transcriptional MerR regulator [Lentzea atacamensis]RAS61178.1 DNA-binding transcriptional MerR regulator [Lentzea atacamensis]